MTHVLLPFMVLPLYSVMRGHPAAATCARRCRSAPAVGRVPCASTCRRPCRASAPAACSCSSWRIGYYITPALVGGAADQMLSYFIAFYTDCRRVNWGMAAALGCVLLATTVVLYALYARLVGIDRLSLG